MAKETNKRDFESMCARVTKVEYFFPLRTQKLIWIDYEQLIMDCCDCIFISTNNLAYSIPIPMFSLVSWFLYCSTCSKSTKSMKPNGNISMEWAKVLAFLWEKVLFWREVKFSYWSPFRKRFLNFKSYKLNNSTVCKTLMLNVFILLEKVFSSLTVHRKPSFHDFHVISMV